MRRLALIGACLLLSTACAGSGAMQRTGGQYLGTGSREEIHMVEYPEMLDLDAYQVVRRIRPFFLQSRGPTSLLLPTNQVTVFIDDMPIGGVSELATIRVRDIRSIRFMSASEAVIRYGRRFAGGIIRLTSR